jgi:2-polyprenyl-6-methoxyphenol hydroxylase-like FAD-dependent oxidoreductase
MSTMLGKGANCALLDAVSLVERIQRPHVLGSSSALYNELRSFSAENVKRRLRERQRGSLVQDLVYFGDNKFKEFWRNRSLRIALGWVEEGEFRG